MNWNYCNENCEYLGKDHKCKADGRIVSTTINVHGLLDISTSHKHIAGCVKDRELKQGEERINKMQEAVVDFIRRRFMRVI